MLKVVGASWSQTRFSTFLIASVAILGMLTILFLEFVPRDVYDGKYAATVFWNERTGFRIEFWGQGNEPRSIRKGVARAYYRPEMLTTGWAVLEIETQAAYPDWVQIHAAGLLEGSLSWQLIYWHWQNTVDTACEGREKICDEISDFLANNTETIREKAFEMSKTDPFWHQVNLFYAQLDGLEVGWRYAVKRSRQEDNVDIPHTDFLWLNAMCDIHDLETKMNSTKVLFPNNRPPLSLALLKIIPDKAKDFILSHATGGYYSSMLRVQKQYKFGLHETSNQKSSRTSGQTLTFTSYPGSLHSQDDFYQILGQNKQNLLLISGTALKNLNPKSWNSVEATEEVLVGPRVLAANRLSKTPEQWAEIVARNSSGTGNKQWLILQPKNSTQNLTVWIAEQMPGLSRGGDISAHLQSNGYFISYGIPMFKDIQSAGGYHQYQCEEMAAARMLLQQGQENVTDLNSMLELMRSPDVSLFGRGDLLSSEEISKQAEELMLSFNDSHTTSHDITMKSLNSKAAVNGKQKNSHSQLDLGLFASKPHKSFKNVFKRIIALKKLRKELAGKNVGKDESSASSESSSSESGENVRSEEEKLIVQVKNKTLTKPHLPKSNTDSQKKDLTGVIDFKIMDGKDESFYAAAGPLFSKSGDQVIIEPFQWSKSPISDHPHNGQSDVWQFEPVRTNWVWIRESRNRIIVK